MGEDGIQNNAEDRLAIAGKIVGRAEALGIPREDITVDRTCMPVSTGPGAALPILETIRLVRAELGFNITLGASNVSVDFPERKMLNAALPLQ